MKRRLLAGALAATMALSMTACGSGGGSSDTQGSGSSDGSSDTQGSGSSDEYQHIY